MQIKFFKNIRWSIHPFLSFFHKRFSYHNKEWIMGRVACMGSDVLKLLNLDVLILNIQKGRVDYLNNTANHPKRKSRTYQVVSFIKRDDIKGLISQQEVQYCNLKKPPIALFMDSFSELTDQLFSHKKQNWQFCANYSDINHTKKFEKKFETLGLLSVDIILDQYRNFFNKFRQRYELVPIIFIHFPVKLDKRKKFHLRYEKIKEAIDILESEFQPFYSVTADEEIVDWPEERIPGLENFPYHYNAETYHNISKKIRKLNLL